MLIGIAGKAGAGKDTVGEMISKLVPWSQIYHFADPVKAFAAAIDPIIEVGKNPDGSVHLCRYNDIVAKYGEPAAKLMPEVRRLYQRIGTEAGRKIIGEQVWIDLMRDWYYSLEPFAVGIVPDVRFLNEADAIHLEDGVLITVTRPDPYDLGENLRHASETEALRLDSDYTICNHSDMEALAKKVQGVLMEIGI
jgi:hypothetical protein